MYLPATASPSAFMSPDSHDALQCSPIPDMAMSLSRHYTKALQRGMRHPHCRCASSRFFQTCDNYHLDSLHPMGNHAYQVPVSLNALAPASTSIQ